MVPLLGAEARDLLVEKPFAFLLTVDRRVRVEVMGLARRTNAGKSEIAGVTTPETQSTFPDWAGKPKPLGESASLPALIRTSDVSGQSVNFSVAYGGFRSFKKTIINT